MVTYSIIRKSQLEGAHRVDAEYYQSEYLENEKVIKNYKNGFKLLGELLKRKNAITGGATPLGAEYLKSGIPFLRVQNVMQNYLELDDVVYISDDIHNGLLKRSKIKPGDILLTITGVSYGKSATIPEDFKEGNINQHSVKIEIDDKVISPEFLSTFLNSKFGKYQSDRKITGLSRPGLVYTELKNILIPLVNLDKQIEIKNLVKISNDILKQSKSLYFQAENLLLEKLGLKDFKPQEDLSYVINFSNVKSARRADAEYFQPKYKKIEEKLIRDFDAKKIKSLDFIKVTTGQYSEEYTSQFDGKPYIRGTDLLQGTVNLDNLVYIDPKLQNPTKKAKEGDVVVTRVGTIGIGARLPKEVEGGTISDNLIRLRFSEEALSSYYVCLFFNTVGAQLMIRESRGSVQARLNQETLREIVLPVLSKPVQQKIADLVRQSHEARKKAKQLLEEAKKGVEDLIESH